MFSYVAKNKQKTKRQKQKKSALSREINYANMSTNYAWVCYDSY